MENLQDAYMTHSDTYRTWLHVTGEVTRCELQNKQNDTWTTIDVRDVPMDDVLAARRTIVKHQHPKQMRRLSRIVDAFNERLKVAVNEMLKGVSVDG